MYSGFDGRDEWYQLFQIGFGGIPERPAGDGADGHSLWPAFTNLPNEFLEAYFLLRIREYATTTITDSGGTGLHRGVNGIECATIGLPASSLCSIHRPSLAFAGASKSLAAARMLQQRTKLTLRLGCSFSRPGETATPAEEQSGDFIITTDSGETFGPLTVDLKP